MGAKGRLSNKVWEVTGDSLRWRKGVVITKNRNKNSRSPQSPPCSVFCASWGWRWHHSPLETVFAKRINSGLPESPDTGPYFNGQFSCLVCDNPSTEKRFFLVLKLLIQFAWGFYFLRKFQKHLKFNCNPSFARESLGAEFSPFPKICRSWHHLRLEGDCG